MAAGVGLYMRLQQSVYSSNYNNQDAFMMAHVASHLLHGCHQAHYKHSLQLSLSLSWPRWTDPCLLNGAKLQLSLCTQSHCSHTCLMPQVPAQVQEEERAAPEACRHPHQEDLHALPTAAAALKGGCTDLVTAAWLSVRSGTSAQKLYVAQAGCHF